MRLQTDFSSEAAELGVTPKECQECRRSKPDHSKYWDLKRPDLCKGCVFASVGLQLKYPAIWGQTYGEIWREQTEKRAPGSFDLTRNMETDWAKGPAKKSVSVAVDEAAKVQDKIEAAA